MRESDTFPFLEVSSDVFPLSHVHVHVSGVSSFYFSLLSYSLYDFIGKGVQRPRSQMFPLSSIYKHTDIERWNCRFADESIDQTAFFSQ